MCPSQDYSVDFKYTEDAENCHKFCGHTEDCKYWSWEPELELCVAYGNCSESGQPVIEPCPKCISGQRLWVKNTLDWLILFTLIIFWRCPARDCHGGFKCQGHFVDSHSFAHLEECIKACKDHEDCHFYTFDKEADICVLYEDCPVKMDCEVCGSGVGTCSRGYHGENGVVDLR